jgi:hypothetical protein
MHAVAAAGFEIVRPNVEGFSRAGRDTGNFIGVSLGQ